MSTTLNVFVSCLPRFEVLLSEEILALLPARKLERKRGGVELRVTLPEMWLLNHELRIAESVRVRLGSFSAGNFEQLSSRLGRLPWSVYYERGVLPRIDVSSAKSALYHDDAVAERVRDFFGVRGAVEHDASIPTVYVRLVNDAAVVSVDASGEGLHRRGLRPLVLRAPLRETYAAACLRIAGLDTSAYLADPVCGTGVFLSERAAMGGGFNLPRHFAFEKWRTHSSETYEQWLAGRPKPQFPSGLQLIGGDKNLTAIRAADENMQGWNAGAGLDLRHADAEDFLASLPDHADVIANPPWGIRMEGAEIVGGIFGRWLRARSPDATGKVGVLVAGHEMLRSSGMRWNELVSFNDGGSTVRLMSYDPRDQR